MRMVLYYYLEGLFFTYLCVCVCLCVLGVGGKKKERESIQEFGRRVPTSPHVAA